MKLFIVISILALFASCSTENHSRMKGTIAMKIDESHGVACVDPVVKAGEEFDVFNTQCNKDYVLKDISSGCESKKIGEVKLTNMLNEHYAKFQTISNFKFEEGNIIKIKK
ncbi:MAG: hypothetical protein K2P81_14705 [Bacteriovoracaceae bacterium]|nr:hypothetical protein [Bacteriovoracaceae bacterium]